ncbi:MAG: sulfotransferase [Actinomycetota bacterium]
MNPPAPTAPPNQSGPTEALSVLFIGGCGRSGSTLVDRILGQSEGVVSVGELTYLWRRGLMDDQECGCGEPFSRCPFWQEVGRIAFGGWSSVDADEMLRIQASVDRQRYLLLMMFPWLSRRFAANITTYRRTMGQLYLAIGRAAQASVVVDSSKHASDAFILRRGLPVGFKLAHLVRDSRGVAYSWTKEVAKPENVHAGSHMRRFHPARMAIRWDVYNLLFHVLAWGRTPSMRVSYERLVEQPHDHVERILSFAGADPGRVSYIDGRSVELSATHTVAGNPMRFRVGRMELKIDDEWERALRGWRRRWVTWLTWPLLRWYGYPVGRA